MATNIAVSVKSAVLSIFYLIRYFALLTRKSDIMLWNAARISPH